LELFYNDRSRKAGKSGRCKVCVNRTNKRYYLKNHEDTLDYMKTWRENNATEFKRGYQDARMRKRYGITLEDYERMMVEQGGGCAICGAYGEPVEERSNEALCRSRPRFWIGERSSLQEMQRRSWGTWRFRRGS